MVAIACTGALLATGIYGVTQLEIDFNPNEYFDIEEGSYQHKFLEAEKLFKKQDQGFLFLGNFNYSSQMDKITSLVDKLDALEAVNVPLNKSMLSRIPAIQLEVQKTGNISDTLASPGGAGFAGVFNISEETKQIQAFWIPFKHFTPHTTAEGMALMDKIDTLVEDEVPQIICISPNNHLNLLRGLTAESLRG